MKIIFMGTPDFAVHSLRRLVLDKSNEVVAVVTQPDKPKGRGKRVMFPPVKEYAIAEGIPVLQPERIKSRAFFNELMSFSPDIIIVAAYGRILPERILNAPRYGCVNIHASLLPKYRGAAPVHWAVMNGEKITGITIIYMDKEIDNGDMILKKELEIGSEDTSGILLEGLGVLGAEAITEAIALIESGFAKREKQDDALSSYAPMLDKNIGLLDWSISADAIINKIRGLYPEPCAYTYFNGEIIKVCAAVKTEYPRTGSYGEVLGIVKNKGFVVGCAEGSILITQVQAPGGKKMSAADYLRGHEMKPGAFLGRP